MNNFGVPRQRCHKWMYTAVLDPKGLYSWLPLESASTASPRELRRAAGAGRLHTARDIVRLAWPPGIGIPGGWDRCLAHAARRACVLRQIVMRLLPMTG